MLACIAATGRHLLGVSWPYHVKQKRVESVLLSECNDGGSTPNSITDE